MQNDSQYSAGEMHAEDIIISSRDIDSNYEPSIEEVKQYGVFLGMDPEEDQEFMYIAEKGLKAPIPAPWKACQTKDGQIYYFNFNTGESQWEHPCDGEFRKEFRQAKELARETEVKTGNKDIEQNILNKEVISNRVNPLEISDLSALLTNQSEKGNKNILDDSIISGFDDIQKSQSKEQANSDEQASQEGGKKEQGNEKSPGKLSRTKNGVNILDFENTEKKENNATKDQELQKIEDEFNTKLENYEKELSIKYEQALLAQKQALEHDQKEKEALDEEMDDIEEDIKDSLLDEIANSAIDDESEKLKDQDALLVNEKLNSLQYNYVLALKAGRDEINLQIQEAERVRSLLLMGNSTASQDSRKELLAEYKKNLQKAELEQQAKLDNEIKLLKNKLSMAYAERGSKEKSEGTSFDELNNPEFFGLQREYEDRLQQEKENMYLQIQETKKNMHKEYAHTYTIPEESKEKKNALYSKIKGIEDERAQYFKLLQGSKETLHSQILRKYELQKLAFENGAGERASGSKKEVKGVDKDLKSVENLFNLLNKLNEEKKSIEKELLAKDNQKYELMMGIKELELSFKEVMQQTEQYNLKIENFKSNTHNRNQMLQKINEMQVQIDSIGKEIKEKEKVRRTSIQSAPRKSNDFARQSLEKLLRKVEGIKDVVTAKQKRRSVMPGQRPYEHSFERHSYFPETETEDASPGLNNRIATADILGMTFQGRDKRSRSSDRKQTYSRYSKGSQLHDMSIDFSKEFKKNRSQWYSTLDADEDRITKNNCSDIWSGLEIEKFKRDLEKEGSFYGKQEKHLKNSEKKKSSKHLNKETFYTSLEQHKTRNTEGDELFTPTHEIGNGLSGNYSFLDRQRNWISTQGPILGLRDPNLKKISTGSTYKNSPTRYGRKSLQNTSEIMSRHEYQRGFAYPMKDNDSFNSRARSIEKKEPTRFLNIKHKIRDERHFHQYDTLIKKYSSGL